MRGKNEKQSVSWFAQCADQGTLFLIGQFVQDGGMCDKIKRYEKGRRAEDCGRERMPWVIDSVWVLPAPEKAVSFISG